MPPNSLLRELERGCFIHWPLSMFPNKSRSRLTSLLALLRNERRALNVQVVPCLIPFAVFWLEIRVSLIFSHFPLYLRQALDVWSSCICLPNSRDERPVLLCQAQVNFIGNRSLFSSRLQRFTAWLRHWLTSGRSSQWDGTTVDHSEKQEGSRWWHKTSELWDN